ncbi:hypothetical protein BJX64DRAFT_292696 [Aspergillus heterothallicus]
MGSLNNQVVIITGTSSGIGLATANLALNEGARVIGIDMSDAAPAELEQNPNFHFVSGDISSSNTSQQAAQAATARFGKVDALFNIAGVMDHYGSVDTVTDSLWERSLAVNLTGPVRLMREVIPIMRRQRSGCIVNVASKAATSGAAAGVAYTASVFFLLIHLFPFHSLALLSSALPHLLIQVPGKHGLLGVTKNVAWRFKEENIRCNAVCPGGVATALTSSPRPIDMDFEALETMKPVHRAHMPPDSNPQPYIRAVDVAATIVFLASETSRHISGAVIPIDNAWSVI